MQFCPSKTVYDIQNGGNQTDTMEAEYISHERLYMSQLVIAIVKMSLNAPDADCYQQFNSLILLDNLFQNLLPVPTFKNELLKQTRNQRRNNEEAAEEPEELNFDVELLSISDQTPEVITLA